MSNNKQNHIGEANKMVSSVEWQHMELIRIDYQYAINKITPREYQEQTKNTLEQAKAMHKEEIMNAIKYGYKRDSYTPNFREQKELFEQYYNATFGGNNEQL